MSYPSSGMLAHSSCQNGDDYSGRMGITMPSRLLQRILRTNLAWKISGLTYSTAVIATHGSKVPPTQYVKDCSAQMQFLRPYLTPESNVLEFGSGIGGNLLALAGSIRSGIGLDVNLGYLHIGRRLARSLGIRNVKFQHFDGMTIPTPEEPPSVVFSIGVFERLTKPEVVNYIGQLAKFLSHHGYLAVYFLSVRARDTEFTTRLGPDAYTYWSLNEAMASLHRLTTSLSIVNVLKWRYADVVVCKKEE